MCQFFKKIGSKITVNFENIYSKTKRNVPKSLHIVLDFIWEIGEPPVRSRLAADDYIG